METQTVKQVLAHQQGVEAGEGAVDEGEEQLRREGGVQEEVVEDEELKVHHKHLVLEEPSRRFLILMVMDHLLQVCDLS